MLSNHAINDKQILFKRRHNVKFVAGTIFIINSKLILNFFKNIDIDLLYSKLECNYVVNTQSTYVHALERIISGFFY